jgi:hypothetical protein
MRRFEAAFSVTSDISVLVYHEQMKCVFPATQRQGRVDREAPNQRKDLKLRRKGTERKKPYCISPIHLDNESSVGCSVITTIIATILEKMYGCDLKQSQQEDVPVHLPGYLAKFVYPVCLYLSIVFYEISV